MLVRLFLFSLSYFILAVQSICLKKSRWMLLIPKSLSFRLLLAPVKSGRFDIASCSESYFKFGRTFIFFVTLSFSPLIGFNQAFYTLYTKEKLPTLKVFIFIEGSFRISWETLYYPANKCSMLSSNFLFIYVVNYGLKNNIKSYSE